VREAASRASPLLTEGRDAVDERCERRVEEIVWPQSDGDAGILRLIEGSHAALSGFAEISVMWLLGLTANALTASNALAEFGGAERLFEHVDAALAVGTPPPNAPTPSSRDRGAW